MPLLRDNVPENEKWDLSGLFKSQEEFEKECAETEAALKLFDRFLKNLTRDTVYDCLELLSSVSRKFEKLYVYASLKSDENTADSFYQALKEKMSMLSVKFSGATSFITPNIAKFPMKTLKELQNNPEKPNFSTYFESIIREKKHILSAKEEKLLAETGNFSGDFKLIFNMFDNADIRFPEIDDGLGGKVELCHGAYSVLMQNKSQSVRKNAFETYYKSYKDMINTLASTYAGSVKKDCAYAKIRGYKSALSRSLESDSVNIKVYDNLIRAVKRGTPAVHRYVRLRKKALKLKELHMYDMYVPITKEYKLEISYDEAYELVKLALKPLGKDYIELLEKARNGRWIDVRETKNKRSGAYSWGCYDSNPVVLLNYQPTAHDVFTIAHELGHAIHSYMSNKNQCYEKAGYEIFVAEVASTVNEVLTIKHLLKTADGEERKFLLSYYLDMMRTTLFRQAMFAEFEKYTHAEIEDGRPLTAESMSNAYYELNKRYYGSGVIHDDDIRYEWSRIPHFYNAFYVYKYSTGITAAINIVKKIESSDEFVKKYFELLSAGGSLRPLEILKLADVDLTSRTPFDVAVKEFEEVLAELKKLI